MKRIQSHTAAALVVAAAVLAATATSAAPDAFAQPTFTEVTPAENPFVTPADEDFWINAVAPADVDGDGDLDLAVLGFYVVYHQSSEDRLLLLLNDGPDGAGGWSFTQVPVPLVDLFAGSSDLAWGDYDGDGDHDLAVASEGRTVLFTNVAGALTGPTDLATRYEEDSAYQGAYDLRSLSWADYDNDGDLDLLVPSVWDDQAFEWATRLLRNDGADGLGGWSFTDAAAAIDPTVHAQSAWADDDGDGDLDLFLVNVDPHTETGFIRRYANDAGTFTGADLVGLRVEHGLADQGDYDADGDLDLLVAGNVQEEDGTYDTVLRVYTRDAAGFTPTTLVDAPNADWLDLHAATWADYDSDGDVDLLVTGNVVGDGEIVGKSEIFAQDGGVFAPLGIELPAPVSSVGRGGAFTWLDLDGDGDLDYLVAGAYYVPGGNGLVEAQIHLYLNDAPGSNQPPAPPTGLAALPGDSAVTLAWDPAADDHTAATALTYELELRPAGQPAGTAERLPEPGGLGAATSWTLAGLPPGRYAWRVAAVDSAYAGGAGAEGVFTLPAAEPIFADGFESGDTAAWSAAAP